MKHFKIIGPVTTREFDIEDDEMLKFEILKTKDYKTPFHKNEIIYLTLKENEE